MTYALLTLEKRHGIARIGMNRPDRGNALSLALMRELIAASASLKDDTETRVVIFRGEGRHFSVGADLKDPERQSQTNDEDLLSRSRSTRLGRELIEAILGIDQITIAQVHGAAAGGAACIATACDFRLGSADCRIGYPEVNLGMNLSWGALPLCYALVGPARTRRLVIGGELEPAQLLLDWGFLDEVVDTANLEKRAGEMAAYYAAKPPLAAQMIKRSINALQFASHAGVMHGDGDQFTLATLSDDFETARQAFLDRTR